jgi:hypothetical protein
MGTGSVVDWNGARHIASARQVLIDDADANCPNWAMHPSVALTLEGQTGKLNLARNGEVLYSEDYDIALIPLAHPRHVPNHQEFSTMALSPGDKLFGRFFREPGSIFPSCDVREILVGGTVATNCRGSPGYSGGGYVSTSDLYVAGYAASHWIEHTQDGGKRSSLHWREERELDVLARW